MAMPDLPTGTVTFFFSDIEGSTRLLQDLGEGYQEVLETHTRLIRDAVRGARGTEVSTEGDSFFVVFSSATDAVSGAVAVQRALAAEPWPPSHDVRVRVGLHTGEGQLGASDYVGIDVHRAARIAGAGHGGQIVLSATTAELTGHDLPPATHLRDLGSHELKDLAYSEHLCQLVVEGLQAEFPPLRAVSAPKSHLPSRNSAFIGRIGETEAVLKALQEHRLVTLTGAGGVGKTSLAIHAAPGVAGLFPDGIWLVELARVGDESLVASAVAEQLQIMEVSTQLVVDTVFSRLARASLLLILDGCEHLIDAVAKFTEGLLRSTVNVHVMATSREALSIGGENVIQVAPLPTPRESIGAVDDLLAYESIALFTDRARQVQPAFEINDQNAAIVVEICRRLDGIPLAIELAAARLKILSVSQLADRLDRQFAILTSDRRDVLPHQQTLEATLDWSYQLLTDLLQLLLCRLSVFSGGFALDAAEEVCPDGLLHRDEILELLGRLVSTSLVLAVDADPMRYRLLEPVAQYARLRLGETEDPADVRQRHGAFFLQLAEEADGELCGPEQAVWFDRLETDRHNLLAALGWLHESHDTEAALRLAGAMRWFWIMRRNVREGAGWLKRVLSDRADAPPDVTARVLSGVGVLAVRRLDFARASEALEEALLLYRQIGDTAGVAQQIYHLAMLAWLQDDLEKADALATEAQDLNQHGEDPWGLALTLGLRGTQARIQGDYETAEAFIVASHEQFLQTGGSLDLGWSFLRLGALARDEGYYKRATSRFQEGRILLAEARDAIGLAHADAGLGAMAWIRGDRARALTLYESALKSFSRTEEVVDHLGAMKIVIQGNPSISEMRQVAQWNKERAAMAKPAGQKAALAEYLYHLGKNAYRQGQSERAGFALVESLALCRDAEDYRGATIALIALGRVCGTDGDWVRATILFSVANTVAEADPFTPWPPLDEPQYHEHVDQARAAVGSDPFDKAWQRGRSMSLDASIAFARNEPGT